MKKTIHAIAGSWDWDGTDTEKGLTLLEWNEKTGALTPADHILPQAKIGCTPVRGKRGVFYTVEETKTADGRQYGGGGFVLVYVLCLILLGLPAMVMEFSLGRASQASPVMMYRKLERPGQKWHIHGYFALAGNIALMAFYTVVTGWMIYYFVMFLLGRTANLGFVTMITNPTVNVVYLAIAVVVGFLVLSFNLQGGLERVTKFLMIGLLCQWGMIPKAPVKHLRYTVSASSDL